jgi:hypothetical protein
MKPILSILVATFTLLGSGCTRFFMPMTDEELQKSKEIHAREDAEWSRMSAYDRMSLREREKRH